MAALARSCWLFLALVLTSGASVDGPPRQRPNIVIVMFDDLSPRIGAFGDKVAHTPNLDAFAREAVRFPNSFVTSPVCAPSRAALFSGRYQQSINAQHMRTKGIRGSKSGGPIPYEAVPPPEVKWLPELLRRAGYYTINTGKTDYQIGDPFTIWDASGQNMDWRKRPKDRPFFAFINLNKTHESYLFPPDAKSTDPMVSMLAARNRSELAQVARLTDPARVHVPAYLPDTPAVRADIAKVYDNLAGEEREVGKIMAALREDGVLDNTIVIVTSDHGDGLPRMKRAIYDSGIRVPLMVRFPDKSGAGSAREELISFVDLAPTVLSLAGQPVPRWMHGRVFTGPNRKTPNAFIFAAADRFDEMPEHQRTVSDGRYQYIRNYRPDLPFFRPLAFREPIATMQELWRLNTAGKLPPRIAQFFATPRPSEELYDLLADPDTVNNIAADPRSARLLGRYRAVLDRWSARTGDSSNVSEAEMIGKQWPGMKQPPTASPAIDLSRGRLAIASETRGASLGYRVNGGPWLLYTAPVPARAGDRVEAKAIRYGFAESAVTAATAK